MWNFVQLLVNLTVLKPCQTITLVTSLISIIDDDEWQIHSTMTSRVYVYEQWIGSLIITRLVTLQWTCQSLHQFLALTRP